jgi:nucleoside-diphosphate-sugar epimerase
VFSAAAASDGHEVQLLTADLLDRQSIARELDLMQPDAVVHLAAISFVGHGDANAFYSVNVIGTMQLLDAIADMKKTPQRVLLTSSANVYGNCTSASITEDSPTVPVNHYAMSKLAMEYMAKTRLDRIPLFITRPFNYTGLGQASNFVIPKLVEHFSQRKSLLRLGNMKIEREFNDVRMVSAAYLRLLSSAVVGETYNVCTGITYTLGQVLELLTDLTGHKLVAETDPQFVRASEIGRLSGAPEKLLRAVGTLPAFDLKQTLSWMLNADEKPVLPNG